LAEFVVGYEFGKSVLFADGLIEIGGSRY